jgi:hypothetical protein
VRTCARAASAESASRRAGSAQPGRAAGRGVAAGHIARAGAGEDGECAAFAAVGEVLEGPAARRSRSVQVDDALPVICELRRHPELLGVGAGSLPWALLLVQALAVEARRRGHEVSVAGGDVPGVVLRVRGRKYGQLMGEEDDDGPAIDELDDMGRASTIFVATGSIDLCGYIENC